VNISCLACARPFVWFTEPYKKKNNPHTLKLSFQMKKLEKEKQGRYKGSRKKGMLRNRKQ
jgi:hypothetical protein